MNDALREYQGYTFDFEGIAKQLVRVLKPHGGIVWVINDATEKGNESGTSFRHALYFKDVLGLNLHDTMIWSKPGPIPRSHPRYEQAFEYMFVFTKGYLPRVFNPLREKSITAGKKRRRSNPRLVNGDNNYKVRTDVWVRNLKILKNVWEIIQDMDKTDHPARFPYKLAWMHVSSWSNPGDVVLDPMVGGGTTLLAAKELGRKYIGIDISDKYCELSRIKVGQSEKVIQTPEQIGGMF